MNIFIFLLINLRSPGNDACATQSVGLSNGCINTKNILSISLGSNIWRYPHFLGTSARSPHSYLRVIQINLFLLKPYSILRKLFPYRMPTFSLFTIFYWLATASFKFKFLLNFLMFFCYLKFQMELTNFHATCYISLSSMLP